MAAITNIKCSFLPEILKMATNTGGGILLFRALARNMAPMVNHHANTLRFLTEPAFLCSLYSLITYTRVRIVCDKSYRVGRPLNSLLHPVFVLGLGHLRFSRHIVSQKQDIIKFAIQLILNGKIL